MLWWFLTTILSTLLGMKEDNRNCLVVLFLTMVTQQPKNMRTNTASDDYDEELCSLTESELRNRYMALEKELADTKRILHEYIAKVRNRDDFIESIMNEERADINNLTKAMKKK